tara:strand:+ start:295 stop:672 length:378 start_codon:yes stop_codon:yes gene_type:complete
MMAAEYPSLATPGRWLRHKKDGTIYGWTKILASNPAVEEVTEEVAFPEKFIPKKQKARKAKLDLATDETSVEEATTAPKKKSKSREALNADASKGLSKKRARNTKGHYKADDPSTPENEAWEDDS